MVCPHVNKVDLVDVQRRVAGADPAQQPLRLTAHKDTQGWPQRC